MVLNVVTPCSRPSNLPKIRDSIVTALSNGPEWKVVWLVVMDAESVDPGIILSGEPNLSVVKLATPSLYNGSQVSRFGNRQRNLALDFARDGWVAFVDDDTELHPSLFEHITKPCLEKPDCSLVVDQTDKNGVIRLVAHGNNIAVGSIDSGQAILNRELVGDTRWPPMDYESDGYFIINIYRKRPESFVFINIGLSVYNFFR